MKRLSVGWTVALIALLIANRTKAQKPDDKTGPLSFVIASDMLLGGSEANPLSPVLALRKTSSPPSFVVATGSLTADGSDRQFSELDETIKRCQAEGLGFYGVPGPHDVTAAAGGKERISKSLGKSFSSADVGVAHLVFLDSTIALQNWGHLDRGEIDWLDKDLKKLKPETPILIFLYHNLFTATPATRLLDNDYELVQHLKGRNVVAIFTSEGGGEPVQHLGACTVINTRPIRGGVIYRVTMSPLIVTVEQISTAPGAKPVKVATLAASTKVRPSILRSTWDDPDIPFLERRRPAATLSPRAVSDNPDKERCEFRIDEGAWKPMTKDRRDIWSDSFPTRPLAVGMHTVDIRLTTSNAIPDQDELIFEVERDSKEETRRWAVDLAGPIASGPAASGDAVYASCLDGRVVSMALANGKKRWTFPARSAFVASPVVASDVVLAACTDHVLYAIEIVGGKQKWRFEAETTLLATPVVAGEVICLPANGCLYGVDLATGVRRWKTPLDGVFATAAATDGTAFYVVNDIGDCVALDARSGTMRWNTASNGKRHRVGFVGAPTAHNGRVYVTAADGAVRCLDAMDGHEIWKGAAREGNEPLATSPCLVGDVVVAASTGQAGQVTAFRAATGEFVWMHTVCQPVSPAGARSIPDGTSLALMGLKGRCEVLDARTGKRAWGYELGPGNVFAAPEFDGKTLLTTTMANDVQAINAPVR